MKKEADFEQQQKKTCSATFTLRPRGTQVYAIGSLKSVKIKTKPTAAKDTTTVTPQRSQQKCR